MELNAIIENFRSTMTGHYFDLKGRVGRERFWYFILAVIVVEIVAAIIQAAMFFLPIAAIVSLALLLPCAGMGARRLQDTGRDGNLVWILVIPMLITQLFALMAIGMFGFMGMVGFYFGIGRLLQLIELLAALALIYFWCQPGDAGPNKYGAPDPAPAKA